MGNVVVWKHDPSDDSGIWWVSDEELHSIPLDVDVMEILHLPDKQGLFKVVVAGGRDFNNLPYMTYELDHLLSEKSKTHVIVIISGTARGADQLGESYAASRGYLVERYPADWNTYGKSAGYRRNAEMADRSDAVVVFWDGRSKGTGHMVDIANSKGLPLRVVNY